MTILSDGTMLALFIRILLFFLLASGAEWGIRRCGGSAAKVYVNWLGFLAATTFLAIATLALPPIVLPVLPALPLNLQLAAASADTVGAANTNWSTAIEIIFLCGAILLLARLLYSRIVLRRLWVAAEPANNRILKLAQDVQQSLNANGDIAVRVSLQPIVPMTWGESRILLPAAATTWSDARLRMILLHETAHIVRGDSGAVLLASIVSILFWIHPCTWIAVRRMKLAQEQAADDMVLETGIIPALYCNDLLEIAAGLTCGPALLTTAASHGGSSLESRFRSALTSRSRAPINRLARTGTLCGAVATAFLAGTLTLGHAQALAPAAEGQVRQPDATLPKGTEPKPVYAPRAAIQPRAAAPGAIESAATMRATATIQPERQHKLAGSDEANLQRVGPAHLAQIAGEQARRQKVDAVRVVQMARDEGRRARDEGRRVQARWGSLPSDLESASGDPPNH